MSPLRRRFLDAVMGRIRPRGLRSPFGLSRSRQSGSPEFQYIVGQVHQGKLPGHLVQTWQQDGRMPRACLISP